jgi:hypothetical protein
MDDREARDELFAAALDAFVETRARLAAALAAAGHKAEAQALKKLRRPTPSAWATNQVVRRARDDVDAFLGASDRLRASQAVLVAGQGDRGVYQADVEELRRATAALSEAARRLLAELGRGEDRALVERVIANARAAALTDAGRAALLEGALAADVEGGVDAFGGLLGAGAAQGTAPQRRPVPQAPAPPSEPSARALERARALEDARRDEVAAREAAAVAEAGSARARAALDEAKQRAEEAQQAARDAETALRTAQRDATEAATRAGRATRHREALEP